MADRGSDPQPDVAAGVAHQHVHVEASGQRRSTWRLGSGAVSSSDSWTATSSRSDGSGCANHPTASCSPGRIRTGALQPRSKSPSPRRVMAPSCPCRIEASTGWGQTGRLSRRAGRAAGHACSKPSPRARLTSDRRDHTSVASLRPQLPCGVDGDGDEVIPVGLSRALRDRLAELGQPEGVDPSTSRSAAGTTTAAPAPEAASCTNRARVLTVASPGRA